MVVRKDGCYEYVNGKVFLNGAEIAKKEEANVVAFRDNGSEEYTHIGLYDCETNTVKHVFDGNVIDTDLESISPLYNHTVFFKC